MQNHRKNEKLRKFAVSETQLGEDKQNQTADLLNAMLYGWKHNEYSQYNESIKSKINE